ESKMSSHNGTLLYIIKLMTATTQLKAYAKLFAATVTKIDYYQLTGDKRFHFTEHPLYVDGSQYSDEQQPLARIINEMYKTVEQIFTNSRRAGCGKGTLVGVTGREWEKEWAGPGRRLAHGGGKNVEFCGLN
ncbi:3406_t:CDS:2, partial [Paraglomus occultum]